jgi:O-antigen/teichoic acid export membrane protein
LILSNIKGAFPSFVTGQIARHSGASFAVKLFSTACGFLFAVAAARLLGPRGYGIIAVATSVANITAIAALLGTNGLAVREVATLAARQAWRQLRGFVRWASITVVGTSLAAALLVETSAFLTGPYSDALRVVAIMIPLIAMLYFLRGAVQGLGRVVEAQVPLDVIRWVLLLSFIGILLFAGISVSPDQILWILVASYAISLLAAAGVLRRSLVSDARDECTHSSGRQWLAKSLPFLSVALFGIVGIEINTLLLGSLAGPRDAGLYQPIARLAPIMIVAREAIEMPLAPRIVSLWERGDRSGLQRLMRLSAFAYVLATAVMAAMILALSPYILEAFGSEFAEYRDYLYWIAAAQIAGAATGAAPLFLAMVGSMRRRVQAQAVTLIVQGGLGVLLVPILGVVGAVISLTAAILIWCLLHWYFAWRETGIDTSALFAVRLIRGSKA